MKFAEHLSAHITPEWRKQYIQYEVMKQKLYEILEEAPSPETTESRIVKRYFDNFEEHFFHFCEKELAKINNFFSEKMAEASRKFGNLQSELNLLQQSNVLRVSGSSSKKRVRKQAGATRKLYDLKLGFSEFYLSLVLLQNYQTLNFTGFRKILKKHDKLLETELGSEWHRSNVEVAVFYMSKDVDRLITETEHIYINDLEGGNRSKAMKRLRVPPFGEQRQQPWVTYRLGLYSGIFTVLLIVVILGEVQRLVMPERGYMIKTWEELERDAENNVTSVPIKPHASPDWLHALRMYRGTFLLILACVLCGVNTYGWRTSGVNHVLIFELEPREHLSHLQIMELGSLLACLWAMSLLCYQHHEFLHIPKFAAPVSLIVLLALFLFNPIHVFYHKSRFWLLRYLWRIMTAPLHHVGFADFWLADQLNSLVTVFLDLEYSVCFCVRHAHHLFGGIPTDDICDGFSYGFRPILAVLPAWFRFAQCLRRYRDTRQGFPHVVNAGKYSTTFFVVAFSSLYIAHKKGYLIEAPAQPNASGLYWQSPFFFMWLISAVVSSCYTYAWDIRMDWGLLDKNAGENKLLREEIVYTHKAYYYFAMIGDLLLRFAWTISVSLVETGIVGVYGEVTKTGLASLEVFRRFVWNFFRLENEHLNNCGEFRAVRDISIAPIDANDHVLLEDMMDSEDGVGNRGLSLSSKRNKQDVRMWLEVEDDDNQATVSSLTEVLKVRLRGRKESKKAGPIDEETDGMLDQL